MTAAMLLAALVLAGVFLFVGYSCAVLRPRRGTLDWVALQDSAPLTFAVRRHKMERKDALPLLLLTAAYAFTAFFSLGSTRAPDYRRACDLSGGATYTIEIDDGPLYTTGLWSYALLGTGSYNLEISEDGQVWSTLWTKQGTDQWGRETTEFYWALAAGYEPSYALSQNYGKLLSWVETVPENPQMVRYIRITGRADNGLLQLGKLLLLDDQHRPMSFTWHPVGQDPLPDHFADVFTLDGSVPQTISWRNSAYFDEIYHPRTALEHIEGVYPYEITHPPMGKLLMGLGIRLFGMTPFGWRFSGTLFGVGMLPLLYLLLKNIFGKTNLAVCGTALLATEFMHLTQTRIATIDTYGVFFVLAATLFFYRWLTAPATPDKNGKVSEGWGSLVLSGLFWGIGCASKWTVIYAGAGLALLYLIHVIQRLRAWDRTEGAPKPWPWLAATVGMGVVSFVVIPAVIYTLSYIPYAQAAGHLSLGGVVDEMWRNQSYMLSYHGGVHSSHPYSSRWYQWLVDARPILYYSKDLGDGMTERFAAFNNPVLSWAGLAAVVICIARCCRRMWAKLCLVAGVGIGCAGVCWLVGQVENGDFDPALSPQDLQRRLILMGLCLLVYLAVAAFLAVQTEGRSSGLDVFIAVGFAAQFLPWVFIGRTTFAYHYFPSTLFLILALCRVFDDLIRSQRARWRVPVYGLTAAAGALYLLFYPALTGLTMPIWYSANILKFLPAWPI